MDDYDIKDVWLEGKRPSVDKPEVCSVCGEVYPRTKFKKYKGKWYGIPCGCYKDINSLIRLETR